MRHLNELQAGERARGQTLVEFGLILPIFFLIIIGIFDVGRAIYAYNTVSNATRQALREAIVHQDPAEVRAVAIRAGVALGLTDEDVVLDPCAELKTGCVYGVTVTYDYEPATPLIGQLFDPVISATGSMPVETVNP